MYGDLNQDLLSAVERGSTDEVRRLLGRGAHINAKEEIRSGWTPLHYAAYHGNVNMIKLLVEHGANVHASDKLGWTPLHAASAAGKHYAVECLVDYGADMAVVTNDNKTPGQLAEQFSRGEIKRR